MQYWLNLDVHGVLSPSILLCQCYICRQPSPIGSGVYKFNCLSLNGNFAMAHRTSHANIYQIEGDCNESTVDFSRNVATVYLFSLT